VGLGVALGLEIPAGWTAGVLAPPGVVSATATALGASINPPTRAGSASIVIGCGFNMDHLSGKRGSARM